MKRRNFLGNLTLFTGGLAFSTENKALDSQSENSLLTVSKQKELKEIRVTAPSVVGVNEPFTVGIRLLTTPFFTGWGPVWQRFGTTVNGSFNVSSRGIRYMDNVLPRFENSVRIEGDEGFSGISTYSFKEGAGPYHNDKRPIRRLDNFKFTTPGVKYIRVVDPETGITGVSNAILVESIPPTDRLYWGNLHCHSIFGDGVRLPEDIYAFARDESFLDVFALTDHTEALTNGQWTYFKQVTNEFNEDGRFVTFLGGEWTSPEHGHKNYIYPGNDGIILRCNDPNQDTPHKVFQLAKKHGALVIANHTASSGHTTRWEGNHDPEVQRLVEVYSIGGINEMMFGFGTRFKNRAKEDEVAGSHAIDGLKRGYRLGMIGTGDDHDGRPGDSLHHLQEKPESYKFLKEPGLMGVWADELSREAIFAALWNRHVFGTTNNRTLLRFSINGHKMGSEIKTRGKLDIQVEVAGNHNIQKVELIKEGQVVDTLEPLKKAVQWSISNQSVSAPTWYYIRVLMDNEHIAWASPIWID